MSPRRSARSLGAIIGLAACSAVAVSVLATVMAVLGSELGCLGGAVAPAQPTTRVAAQEISPSRLKLYRAAGVRFDIAWTFVASIGTQECGSGDCAGDNGSGCAGPMQIAAVRESPCSPGSGPTLWERFGIDADGDGKADVNDPADAIFAAARIMRVVMHAPPAGGSYAGYRQAACNYYGACGDGVAAYADEVMARAVSYGFRGEGSPRLSEPEVVSPGSAEEQGSVCGAPGGGAPGNEIVRIAESQLGRTESPPGSNCNPYGPCVEWCSLFVAWVWERAGVPLGGATASYAYSGSIYEWARAHGGRVLPPSATPAPGDAVLFGSGPAASDHIAVVERVFPDGEITTIDGNYGDRVARVGPFPPARAVRFGEPSPIFGYAEPPSPASGEGEVGGRA